jgi:hypothetical protein
MKIFSDIIKKIESAILNFWDMGQPKTVFVPVRIYRKK